MRRSVLMVYLVAAMATGVDAQTKFGPPDHKRANIDGMQGVMFVSAVENEHGNWDPVSLPDCQVNLAPSTELHEHIAFPCNEWFVAPAEGSYLVWLASKNAVSTTQSIFMARDVPYSGFGSIAIHHLAPAGFVTVDGSIPAGHTVRFLHLDAPGGGFMLRVSSRDAGRRFPMPPGRVIAGIFNSRDDAVSHGPPLTVKAGEVTAFRITPPDSGSDLLVVLTRPQHHRDGRPPLDLVVKGAVERPPDVQWDRQGRYVLAVWYGLPEKRVTVSATSATLEWKREIELRPGTVSTLRAELTVRQGNEK